MYFNNLFNSRRNGISNLTNDTPLRVGGGPSPAQLGFAQWMSSNHNTNDINNLSNDSQIASQAHGINNLSNHSHHASPAALNRHLNSSYHASVLGKRDQLPKSWYENAPFDELSESSQARKGVEIYFNKLNPNAEKNIPTVLKVISKSYAHFQSKDL